MNRGLPSWAWTIFNDGVPRRADLDEVNAVVNDRIEPCQADAARPWRVIVADAADKRGCCHDYAVTKRAELLARGWPASRLLLTEVAYDAKDDHMILLAVANDGALLALDNLRPDIVLWAQTGYRLKWRQTAGDPNVWEDEA